MIKRELGIREEPFFGKAYKTNFLELGRIAFVDYERNKCSVLTFSGAFYNEVRWTSDKSTRSGSKRVPELGDIVLLGRLPQTEHWSQPIIIGFLEWGFEPAKKFNALNSQVVDLYPLRLKTRKLYEGEWYASSTQGSDIVLDENIWFSTSNGNEIYIRKEDGLIAHICLSQIIQTEAGIIRNGLVFRDELTDITKAMILKDGHKWYVITKDGFTNKLSEGGIPFVEYRHELPEFGDGIIDVTEFNSNVNIDRIDPLIEYVRGTVIGNNPLDTNLYGKVIKYVLFNNWIDTSAINQEQSCSSSEETTKASCFRIKFKSNTRREITKQGKVLEYISKDDNNISEERYLEGAKKEVIGKENSKNESIRQDLAGGIHLTIGKDINGNARVEILNGGAKITITQANNNGYGLEASIQGNVKVDIQGNADLNVSGNTNLITGGNTSIQSSGIVTIRGSLVQIN